MSPHPRHEAPSRRSALLWPGRPRHGWSWRIAGLVAFGFAGLLAVTSAVNARGTDLRGGRNDSLIDIVSTERRKVESQLAVTRTLQAQVDALTASLAGRQASRLQAQLRRLEAPAGLSSLSGPGIVVTLDDAPRDQESPGDIDPNLLVVHQQDIQAVTNALWSGGAEGISLQGRRIIATTGIKCVGNTVVLQGVPYAPPYRIVAVGDVRTMDAALRTSPEVHNYRDYVPPPYNLGWSVRHGDDLRVPGYAGPLTLQYAEPAGS